MGSEAIQLTNAQLQAGPQTVSDGSAFPAGQATIPLALLPTQKPYVVLGSATLNLQSPLAYVPLSAVGATGPVTQAHTLYVRSNAPIQLQLTYLGDSTPHTTYLMGLLVLEADPSHPIVAVAAQGAAFVESLAVGNQ